MLFKKDDSKLKKELCQDIFSSRVENAFLVVKLKIIISWIKIIAGNMSGSRQLPKLKHIESFLSDLDNFEKGEFSKLSLEQHMTPPNVAAICASIVAEVRNR